MAQITQKVLNDVVATKNGKGKSYTEAEWLEKFPEFGGDTTLLHAAMDYVATSNSKKYKTLEELNSKFPEFFGEESKSQSQESDSSVLPTDVVGVSKRVPKQSNVPSATDAELHERFKTTQQQPQQPSDVEFALQHGLIPKQKDNSSEIVDRIASMAGSAPKTIEQMTAERQERDKAEKEKAKQQMNKVRREYAQEVYDRRYLNKDGKPKDSFVKDIFENWQAGVGEIALTPYKAIEAAENFGLDIENKLRGTNFQHGTGIATRFMNNVLGGNYLRSQVEHYRKEGDRYQDNKGIVESAVEGDFGTAAGKAVLNTIQSAPNLAVSIYSGKKGIETLGGVFLGTTAALQKYDEIKDNDNISSADKALSMFGAFVSECVPEIIGAKRYGKMFNQQTVGAVRRETQKEVMNAWQKFVNSDFMKVSGKVWDWYMKYFGEGTTEAMTDIMNLGIDIALGIKDGVTKKDLMSIGDSFIVGQLSDAIPSGVHFYQQKSYEHAVKKEIEESPTLMFVVKQQDTTPEEVAKIAAKKVYQETVSDKEEKIYNAYVDALAEHTNASVNLNTVLSEAGLELSGDTYNIYQQAVDATSKTDEEADAIMKKDAKSMTKEDVAYLKELSDKMREIATAENVPVEEATVDVQQPEREVLSTGTKPLEFTVKMKDEVRESGKTSERISDVKVAFRSDGYSIADDGSLVAEHFTLLEKGKPVTGKRKAELMNAINEQLRAEKKAADIKATEEANAQAAAEEAAAQEQAAQQQAVAEAEAAVQAEEQRVNGIYDEMTALVQEGGAEALRKVKSPEKRFIYLMKKYGVEKAAEFARDAIAKAEKESDALVAMETVSEWQALLDKYAPEQKAQPAPVAETPAPAISTVNTEEGAKGLLGTVYTQFVGKLKEAVDFLKQKREGFAKDVLTHPEVKEAIGLYWGTKKAGLKKIIEKHPEVVYDLQNILNGTHITAESDNRIVLESPTHRVVISKMLGDKKTDNWVLSAYEKKDASGGSSDIGPEPGGLQNGTAPLQSNLSERKGTTKKPDTQEKNKKSAEKVDSVAETPQSSHEIPNVARGYVEGMKIYDSNGDIASNIYLVYGSNGSPSLVQSDEVPEGGVKPAKVYFDSEGKKPYIWWDSRKRSSNLVYIDENGVKHEVSRLGAYMEDPDNAGKIIPVPVSEKPHVTQIETILAPTVIAGKKYSIADLLKVEDIGSTVAEGGTGKKYLSGYQKAAQEIEASGLTSAEEENDLRALRTFINRKIAEWNSFTEVLENTPLEGKTLEEVFGPAQAMRLSLLRDARDNAAIKGDKGEVERIQDDILYPKNQFRVNSVQYDYKKGKNNLTQGNFENPLFQLTLMMNIAKTLGVVPESVSLELPPSLQRIANSTILPKQTIIDKRAEYKEKTRLKRKTEYITNEFPEAATDLPYLLRFGYPDNEGGKRTKSNKHFDSKLGEVYQKMESALKRKALEEAGGQDYKDLKEAASKLITVVNAGDMAKAEELNNIIAEIMSRHAGEPSFESAKRNAQKKVNDAMRANNPDAARKADVKQQRENLQKELETAQKKKKEAAEGKNTRQYVPKFAEEEDNTKSAIAELEATNAALFTEFAAESKLAEEVAAIQDMEAQMLEPVRNEKQSKERGQLVEQYEKYIEDHPEAAARVEELRNEKKKTAGGLDLSVQPEMAVVSEDEVPIITPETRLALSALRRVIGWSGIQLHYVGTQEQARKALEEIKGSPELETFEAPNGIILGWAIGNEIYVSEEGLNSETPIHEYTHLWVKSLRNEQPEAWEKIKALCKKNKHLWNKVVNDPNYANIKNDEDAIASEMLSRFSGKRGAARLEEMAREIAKESGLSSKKMVDSIIKGMRNALDEFWEAFKRLFNIGENVKLEEISDWVLKDLFDGKPLNLNTQEMNEIKEQAIKDGTFMKANGRDTKLTERQWLSVRTKAFKEMYGDWENDPENATKILDENGEPMVVYHGTEEAGYDEIIPQENGKANGRGIFTTPQRFVAGVYANLTGEENNEFEARIGQEEHRGIYSLFANIKKPLVVEGFNEETQQPSMWKEVPTGIWTIEWEGKTNYFTSHEDAEAWMIEHGFGITDEWNPDQEETEEPRIVAQTMTTDEFVEKARREGYDGVIFHNIIDGTDSQLLNDDEEGSLYMRAHDVIVGFTSNQFKSAVSNNGLYSQEDAHIEYQYAENEIKQLDEPAEKLIRKQEDKGTATMLDPDLSEQERSNWWESVVTRLMDQSNGMRLMLNSINAYRKVNGMEPLDMDKYDVRTKFEACRSIIANKVGFLERGIQQELDDALRTFAGVIEDSEFYHQHMKEVGGEKPTTLTPIQFIERYLMARNNWERAKEGVPRGLAEFKERMGMGVIEFSNAFTEAYGEQTVLDIWEKIRKMTDFALDTNLEGGLISKELYDELKAKKFYVPQRGFWDDVNPENEEKDEKDLLLRRTRGNVTSRNKLDSMHKAEGGKSLADGCLAYINRDARQAIKLSEENKVKKVMFDLLRDNADWCHEPEHNFSVPRQVFYVDDGEGGIKVMDDGPTEEQKQEMRQLKAIVKQLKEEYKKAETEEEKADIAAEIEATEVQYPYFDEKDSFRILHSRVSGQYDSKGVRKKANAAKAIVGLYVDGVPCEIEMTPRFVQTADALNGRTDRRWILSGLKTVTSWLSAQFTMNNPTFFAVNITRDTPLILTKGAAEYGPEFSARFTANWALSQKAIWKYLITGKVENTAIGAQLNDFLMNGGNTGYSNLEELERWRRKVADLNPGGFEALQRELSTVEGAKKAGKVLAAAGKGLVKLGDKTLSWAELRPMAQVLNEWSEIISRFSAYKSVVDMGLGINEGIHAAHNLSTNFNRKGLGAPFINLFNTLTVFANASIQGASGYWRTLDAQGGAGDKAKKIAKTAAYMGMLPAFLGFLCTMFNPDDDEYEYMVSEYERDNYVILGDKRLALNEQLKPWWVIGVNIALGLRGKRTAAQMRNSILTSIMTNWMPLPQNLTGATNMFIENTTGKEEWNIAQIARTAIMPSAMQTMNQWADNKNFLGGKLRYDIGDIPEYEMAPNEAELYKDLAHVFYVWGGGNELVPSKTREDGGKMRRWWDVNPKEIKSNTFWIPSGAMDNFCLAYGLAKDVKGMIDGDFTGTNVRTKDLPVINRFYKPSDKTLYRYAVVRQARDIVQKHNDKIKNYEKQVTHFSDVYNQTGSEEAKASMEEAIRLLTQESKDVTAEKLKAILKGYDEASIRSLQNKLGESNKELNRYHGDAVDKLDAVEKELVQMLLEGVNLKTGLRHSTDVPEWIEWFDDHSGPRQDRREE